VPLLGSGLASTHRADWGCRPVFHLSDDRSAKDRWWGVSARRGAKV